MVTASKKGKRSNQMVVTRILPNFR
jgi:hypothetical protein